MKPRMLIWAALLLLPLSCVREALREDVPDREILFSVVDTKAQPLEDAAAVAEAYGQEGIGLIAYSYEQADGIRTRYPAGEEAYDSFDYDARKAYRLTRDGNGLWHTDVRSLHWTREVRYLRFFAFAPFDLPVTSGEHSLPLISDLTVEDPATQADILVAAHQAEQRHSMATERQGGRRHVEQYHRDTQQQPVRRKATDTTRQMVYRHIKQRHHTA